MSRLAPGNTVSRVLGPTADQKTGWITDQLYLFGISKMAGRHQNQTVSPKTVTDRNQTKEENARNNKNRTGT